MLHMLCEGPLGEFDTQNLLNERRTEGIASQIPNKMPDQNLKWMEKRKINLNKSYK